MTSITITGTYTNADGSIPSGKSIVAALQTDHLFSGGNNISKLRVSAAIDADTGAFSLTLAVPDDADEAALYHFDLPDGQYFPAAVSQGSSTTWATFVSEATTIETYDGAATFAHLVSSATNGNLASLDADGDLADSGIAGSAVSGHIASSSNPHSVTTTQIGALAVANNLSDLGSATAARTNLGLGSAAVEATTAFDAAGSASAAQTAAQNYAAGLVDDLSGVSDAAAARTNLGLGTAAVEDTGAFDAAGSASAAQTAAQNYAAGLVDDLSGVTDAATARTNLGLGTMAVEDTSAFDAAGTAATKIPLDATISAKTGAYQLAAGDEAKIIECDGTFTVTLPNGLDAGFQAVIVNVGTGTITLAAATTLQSKDSATQLASQYTAATVYHRGSNVWLAVGGLE